MLLSRPENQVLACVKFNSLMKRAASTKGGVIQANRYVVFEHARNVAAQPGADVNLPVAELQWNLSLDGGPLPDSGNENGEIRARSAGDGEDIYFGQTNPLGNLGSSRLLVPGQYAAFFSGLTGGSQLPVNTRATLDGDFTVSDNASGTQTIDLLTGLWAFTFNSNGVPFANDPTRRARFELRHREDVVNIGATNQLFGYRRLLANPLPLEDGRTATVYYIWQEGDPAEMPRNIGAPVACYAFVTPGG